MQEKIKKFFKELERVFYSKKIGIEVDEVIHIKPHGELIQGERLLSILNEIITPYMKELGLYWRGDYYWLGESKDSIRKVFKYDLLKGGQGTFSWGVSLDFISMPSGNKLVYHRTKKSVKQHLFEWPMGYSYCFYGCKIKHGDGVTEHWGTDKTQDTINRVISREYDGIKSWFDKTSNIIDLIEITEKQVYGKEKINGQEYNIYSMHHPSPKYTLAFLYAKVGRITDAKELLEAAKVIDFEKYPELKEKVILKLEELASSDR